MIIRSEKLSRGVIVSQQSQSCAVTLCTQELLNSQLRTRLLTPTDTNPQESWVRVRMSDLSAMLHDEDLCRYCPIYATRTKTNQALKPIAEYVTVFADQPSQSGHRRYKYSEGCKNLQLTDKGKHLDPSTLLVTIWRRCHKDCSALQWEERVTCADVAQRLVQVR